MSKFWMIRMPDEDTEDLGLAYWSNTEGVCHRDEADVLTEADRENGRLPVGGVWETT
jgi:hypothetical protein